MADIQEILIGSKISKLTPKRSDSAQGLSKPEHGKFDKALESAELNISKHASKRLDARNIDLTDTDRGKLTDAVSSLDKKGAKDSLVLMGELAFIVNVPSKTVVTAMSKDQMNEQVFTNIDSTILVN